MGNELLADTELAKAHGRIETDRHGHILVSPPAAARHGGFQRAIAYILRTWTVEGRVLTECPISTEDGVRAADVAWASPECLHALGNHPCFPRAPEVCVKIHSPGNPAAEIQEKLALYFDAGAREVWLCDAAGAVQFVACPPREMFAVSQVCPALPRRVELRWTEVRRPTSVPHPRRAPGAPSRVRGEQTPRNHRRA